MMRTCIAVILFILALGAMPGDQEKKWLTCDVCGTLLHTNQAKIEKGSTFYNAPKHNTVSTYNNYTAGVVIQLDGADVTTTAVSTGVTYGAISEDIKAAHSGEEYSGVIAGHSNATPGICKPCYDRFAWTIFKKQDEQWKEYWHGVKGEMASERKKNLATLTDSSDSRSRHRIETQIDSLKRRLRELGSR